MPIFNDGQYLEKSIKSIEKQTLKDIELICVNDGSTDNTADFLEEYQKEYDWIKVYNQRNQGSGKARNKGMLNSTGEYIGFLDADDFFIDEQSLEKLYNIAKINDANMVSGNIKLVDGENNFSPFKDLDYYEEDSKILPENYGIPWAFYKSIYKREFLLDNKIFFPDLIRGQDPVFLAEALSKVDIIYTANIDFYAYYYINGANQCNTFKKRYHHITHFKEVFKYFSDPKFNDLKKQFKKKLFIFIDMMGVEGAEDTLFSIRELFKDNEILVSECEEYYYSKFINNKEMLERLDLLNSPKISVVIPVYNAEPFLKDAINSVLNQTLKNIELVCVNDGSTDNSLEMLNEFAKKDFRVIVIDKENGGCGSARNKSLDNVRGDYIYFFDPDDYVLPNAFEDLYYNALKNNSDLVMFKIARFRDGEPIDYSIPGFNFDEIFPNVDFNNFTFNYKDIKKYVLNSSFAPWSKLYKKKFIDSFENFRFDLNVAFDDVPFHVKSLLRASRISFVPEFYYHYRLSNPNSVNNTKSNQIDIFKICNLVEDFLIESKHYDEFVKEFTEFKIEQIMNYIISCNYEEYYKLAKQEFKKMNLNGLNIKNHLLTNYNDVLNSNSYNEFRINRGCLPINDESNNPPKVSIIVPVYNASKYIRECLDSLINQTLKEIEIICVNDGSTDNSLEILKEYEQKDSRIKIISKENGGAGSARNVGFQNATGEFINFIDSDDWLELNTFEELYAKSKNENLDVLMYLLINFKDDTNEEYETDYYNLTCIDSSFDNTVFDYEDISDKMFNIAVSPCNKLINREFWKSLNYKFFEGVMFEDNPFFFNLFLEAKRISLIRKHYYHRRRREGSVMSLNGKKLIDIMPMTDEVVKVFIEKGLQHKYKTRLTNFKFYSMKTFYNQINEEHKKLYFETMKNNIENIRSDNELFELFNSGLYSDTKKWFKTVLFTDNYKEFEFLLENDANKIIQKLSDEKLLNQRLQKEKEEMKNKFETLNTKLTQKNNKLIEINNKLNQHNRNLNLKMNRQQEEIIFLKKSKTQLTNQINQKRRFNLNKINIFK